MSDDTKHAGKTVLIVDDEADLADALATALNDEGFETLVARNGAEGLTVALEKHPDLILLDLLMPEMDGHEVLARLREDEWGTDARVIIMSVLDDMENIAEGVEADVNEYIVKSQKSFVEIVAAIKEKLAS